MTIETPDDGGFGASGRMTTTGTTTMITTTGIGITEPAVVVFRR